MEMLGIVVISGILLTIAYFTYGRVLSRLLEFIDRVPTPAVYMRDDVDSLASDAGSLLKYHFSAIGEPGPAVGRIRRGV